MPKKKVTEAVEEVIQEPVISEPVPPQAPRRQGSDDLLELNDLERGVTREDSEDAKWGYLAGAARRQQILTGIVSSGIIQTENGLPVCPVDFEGLRILIPIREMVLTEWPEEDPIPRSVRIQIGRMLGATIDFIPAAVDIRNRAAVGSRKAAMLQRQKRYYATGRVKPGILMACRVLGVGNNTMTVEACGVDTEIYARNVSWEWFSDIADLHSTGDLVVARVMDVSYNEERDVYSVNLSIKEASENPDRAALEKITPNSNYFGVVTGVKDRVFFVRLQVGVNAKTILLLFRQADTYLAQFNQHILDRIRCAQMTNILGSPMKPHNLFRLCTAVLCQQGRISGGDFLVIAYNRGCPKERTAHRCTLREGSNYSTTPWFFQKLCCTFSVLVSHIWGIKMNILQKLFQGKCIPVSEHGGNSSCEYEEAVEKLCKIAETLRQYGVPEELISALDKAENEILALEEERMFRFAIRYRVELQRELM